MVHRAPAVLRRPACQAGSGRKLDRGVADLPAVPGRDRRGRGVVRPRVARRDARRPGPGAPGRGRARARHRRDGPREHPVGGAHRPEPRLQAHGHDLGHRVRRRRPDDRRRGARGGARRPGRRDRHDDRAERFALPVAGPQVHPVVRRREARSRGDAQVPGAELVVPAVERGDEDHDGWRRDASSASRASASEPPATR